MRCMFHYYGNNCKSQPLAWSLIHFTGRSLSCFEVCVSVTSLSVDIASLYCFLHISPLSSERRCNILEYLPQREGRRRLDEELDDSQGNNIHMIHVVFGSYIFKNSSILLDVKITSLNLNLLIVITIKSILKIYHEVGIFTFLILMHSVVSLHRTVGLIYIPARHPSGCLQRGLPWPLRFHSQPALIKLIVKTTIQLTMSDITTSPTNYMRHHPRSYLA